MSAHLKPTMRFEEAMALIQQGKKVARKEWWKVHSGGRFTFQDWYDRGPCLFRHEEFDKIVFRTHTGDIVTRNLLFDDLQAVDWIEVE